MTLSLTSCQDISQVPYLLPGYLPGPILGVCPILENSLIPLPSAVLGLVKPPSPGPQALPVSQALALIFFYFFYWGITDK